MKSIRTKYPTTVSMVDNDLSLWSLDPVLKQVVCFFSGKILGQITFEHFSQNYYTRTASNRRPVLVCNFQPLEPIKPKTIIRKAGAHEVL